MPFRLRHYPSQAPATQDAQKNLERPSAQDIYEQVANNARQELGRSTVSLAISGLAGGIFMGLSALGNAIAVALPTPRDHPLRRQDVLPPRLHRRHPRPLPALHREHPLPRSPRPRRKNPLL